MNDVYSYTIDADTNCVHVFMGDREIMTQPYNPETGKKFTKAAAAEWGEAQTDEKNLANEPANQNEGV